MNKLLICLVLMCFQAFSLTHFDDQSHLPSNKIDPDHTNWGAVTVVLKTLNAMESLPDFVNSRVLNNYTHSEILYQRAISISQLPNVYATLLGHELNNIETFLDSATYYYKFRIQNVYTKDIYEPQFSFVININNQQAYDPVNCALYRMTTTPNPINPPIPASSLRFTNTTVLTYDLLALLWNVPLMEGTVEAVKVFTHAEADKIVGKGQYASIDFESTTVYVEDKDLKFVLEGSIWKDDQHSYYKRFEMSVQLNVLDKTISHWTSNIDSGWIPTL